MRLHSLKIFFTFVLICCYNFLPAQYTIPEKPAVLYPVYDEANLLTQQEKNELNNKLIKFADSTSTEIEIIIIPSTKGEDVNFLATMFGEKWGIGQKNIDNGVVFLIAKDDQTMAIQQGRAVEQYLTASVAGQILDYIVTPNFRQGKWYEGIDGGTNAIMESVQGKFKPLAKERSGSSGTVKLMIIAFVIFIILMILFKNKGGGDDDGDIILSRRGRRNYPGGFFPFPFPGSFGGGGFGGGSSRGGGGFGGFGGGGSFGGGGASGGW